MYALLFFGSWIYTHRPFPWNWILYIPLLAFSAFLSAFVAAALLRWMRPVGPYWQVFRASWKINAVACMVGGIAAYAVLQIQARLQARNKLLEQVVERGTLQLQQQEQELQRALEIQKDLLPKELPQLPGIELAGAWQPARTVGGDYFDVLRLDDHRLGICVGDVSGKGLTASLLMANLQAAFRAYATPDISPAMVCAKLNAFVCGNVAPGKFITFFLWDFGRAEENPYVRKRGTLSRDSAARGRGNGIAVRAGWSSWGAAGVDVSGFHDSTGFGRPVVVLH